MKQQLKEKIMSGNQTEQITVTHGDGGVETTSVYAVDEDISHELARHMRKPTAKNLQAWLEKKGCQLDWSGGPAVTKIS